MIALTHPIPKSKWYMLGVEWGEGIYYEAFCGCYSGNVWLFTFKNFQTMKRMIKRDRQNDKFFNLKVQKESSKKRSQG